MKRIFLLAACTAMTACTGHIASTQISELDEARAMIQQAKDAGAEKCAPALQAKAVVKMYHAAHEITDEVGSHPDENAELLADALATAKKAYVKAKKGCAKPVLEVIRLEGVFFETNSAKLTVASMAVLDNAVKTLQKRADINVEVAAHTDSKGKAAYNLGLSNRRATSVMNYFLGHGIKAARLTSQGYGETQPRADNSTVEGRAKNRRVSLRVK
ncbi:MAG: OmpA family protein [Mariprofundaceae bacterium]|nr:OmpA family protein [Mariprofundaceae bacterium]